MGQSTSYSVAAGIADPRRNGAARDQHGKDAQPSPSREPALEPEPAGFEIGQWVEIPHPEYGTAFALKMVHGFLIRTVEISHSGIPAGAALAFVPDPGGAFDALVEAARKAPKPDRLPRARRQADF